MKPARQRVLAHRKRKAASQAREPQSKAAVRPRATIAHNMLGLDMAVAAALVAGRDLGAILRRRP